jgi:hypothetical protein
VDSRLSLSHRREYSIGLTCGRRECLGFRLVNNQVWNPVDEDHGPDESWAKSDG